MTKSTRAMVVGAAMAGLFTGASAVRAHATTLPDAKAGSLLQKMEDSDKGKHDCKGKNDCKGQGGCKTDANSCKGKNDCKGKGGCKTEKI